MSSMTSLTHTIALALCLSTLASAACLPEAHSSKPTCTAAYAACGNDAPCCNFRGIEMTCSHAPWDQSKAVCVPKGKNSSAAKCIAPYTSCGSWMRKPCCSNNGQKFQCGHAPWNPSESVCVPYGAEKKCTAPYKACGSDAPCCDYEGRKWECTHAPWKKSLAVCMPYREQRRR